MKVKELRIGNYVNYVSQKVIVLQTSIEGRNDWDVELGYFEDSIGFPRKINKITPIPITKEWLLKFGFKKEERKLYSLYVDDNLDISLWSDIYFKNPTIELTCNGRVVCKDIKYIHQLQNLYFALTGEELKIQQ